MDSRSTGYEHCRESYVTQDNMNHNNQLRHEAYWERDTDYYNNHNTERTTSRYPTIHTDENNHREQESEDGDIVTGVVIKPPKTAIDWLRRWAIQTSCNGIPNIQRTKSPVRLAIWLMIVITGTVLTAISVLQTIQLYMDRPFNVAVSSNLYSSIRFPAVTICNINPVRRTAILQGKGGKKLQEILIDRYEKRKSAFEVTFDRHERAEIKEDFDNTYANLSRDVQKELGHQLSDMLLNCNYGSTPCNISDFKLLPNSYYGNCYVINNALEGEKAFSTHKPGSHHGLNLEFYLQPEEYVPALTTSIGMRIAITGPEDMPFPEDTGLLITPGYTTLIALRAREIKRLITPYKSACWHLEKHEAVAHSVYSQHYNVDYTQQACQKTCYQRYVLERCGCGDPTVPLNGIALGNDDNAPAYPCLTHQEEECEEENKALANENKLKCNCSAACESISYFPTISASKWPNALIRPVYTDALKKLFPHLNHSADYDARESIARVQIFYDQLVIDEVVEQPSYEAINLYSDLGGNLGFYLGLSIIGMFEVFELMVDLTGVFFKFLCHCRRTKSRTDTQRPGQRNMKEPTKEQAL